MINKQSVCQRLDKIRKELCENVHKCSECPAYDFDKCNCSLDQLKRKVMIL